MVGEWEGINRTWFEPGKPADESPISGVMRQLPGSPFVIYEYHSTIQGQAFHGLAIFSFNQFTRQFESAWVDSFHQSTYTMISSGPGDTAGFAVLGSIVVPDGPAWGWRTEVKVSNPDALTITAYIIEPQGEESKGVETVYQRK